MLKWDITEMQRIHHRRLLQILHPLVETRLLSDNLKFQEFSAFFSETLAFASEALDGSLANTIGKFDGFTGSIAPHLNVKSGS